MEGSVTTFRVRLLGALLLVGCDHSASFATPSTPTLGPFSAGADIVLTFNPDQNYWPVLTEDSTGVLYAFVDSTQSNSISYRHRCMGLLPVAGGTRRWQWCDDRVELGDSVSGFAAYALGSDGPLLYVESTQIPALSFVPGVTTLWLADTTFPFRRRALLTLPVIIADSAVSWFADLQWTGPLNFIALAQRYVPTEVGSSGVDSVFYGEMVARGVIGPASASLQSVRGTEGATSYAFAENGASIVFTMRNSAQLFKVPAAGGTPMAVATVTTAAGVQLFGVSCRNSTCVVGVGPVTIWAAAVPGPGSDVTTINAGLSELRMISLASGASTPLMSIPTADAFGNLFARAGVFSSPLIASASGDVIAQFGSMMGHLQTNLPTTAKLHLYSGLLH
jgi:hypothetical protein